MMTVTLDRSGKYLYVTGAYIYGKRMHNVPGMKFDYNRKIWWNTRNAIYAFDNEFHGEVYYKTPLWVIENLPAPDYSKTYAVNPGIKLSPLKLPLYGYQDFGARFMIDRIMKHGFVINADGVGIGKTAQAIAVMQWFAEHRGVRHFLIIGKKSIKYQWADEIARFSTLPDQGYKTFYTPDLKKKRIKTYKEATENEKSILITNYQNFLNDTDLIKAYGAGFCVVDEAHSVKARKGVMNNNIAKAVKGTPTAFLTGTPVMSRPEDIFGIVQMSDPGYFGAWYSFRERYLVISNKFGYYFVAGVKNLDELHDKVQDVVIRRTEFEVSVQMPEVVYHNVHVEASPLQMDIFDNIKAQIKVIQDDYKYYDERLKEDAEDVVAKDGREKAANQMKSFIAAKQTAATDPKIFLTGESRFAKKFAESVPEKTPASPKTEAILDLVADINESGDKVILFSKFVTTCKYYADLLDKKKINVLMYTGLEDDEERIENIKIFRSSDDFNVLIGSDAMAEGLNLAEARHVINIDLPDTYAIYTQRFGRARRVSSKFANVVVHNILTEGSCDEDKFNRLKENKDLDGALVAVNDAQRQALIQAQGA